MNKPISCSRLTYPWFGIFHEYSFTSQKLVDSANDVLERAAKKGLLKGTKRGKRPPSSKDVKKPNATANVAEKYSLDRKHLDEMPERLEHLVVETRDQKESKIELPTKEKRDKSGRKKKTLKPFQF